MGIFDKEQEFLLDHSGSIIYVVDKDTHELLYANSDALTAWNKVGQDTSGKMCYSFVNGRDDPCPWCSLPLMEDGRHYLESTYFPLQDMWLSIECIAMEWHGREAVAIYTKDITKQQKRQEELELDVRNIDDILGNVPGGIAVFSDQNGRIRLEYTNDGFYEIHFGSRDFWMEKSDNPVDWILQEDGYLFNAEFQKVKNDEISKGDVTYRILGGDGRIHWINNQFRKAYELNGIQHYYSTFTCLDRQKQEENAKNEALRINEAALEETNLTVWEYDIVNRKIKIVPNRWSRNECSQYDIPMEIEDVPESLLPLIEEADTEKFLAMYRQIQNGAPRASCDVWYRKKENREPHCQHVSYMTRFDENGRPVTALGVGQNITSQVLEKENYNRLYRQLSATFPDTVSSTQLNLTQNRYIKGYSIYPQVLSRLEQKTADEHFAAAAKAIVNKSVQEYILKEYTCENLIRLFQNGKTELSQEYPIVTSKGGIMWVNTTFHMLQNPDTEDIEALTCTTDITRQKKDEEIIHRFAQDGCDFIGIVDPVENTFEMHYGVWDCLECPQGEKLNFIDIQGVLANVYVCEDGREQFLKETAIEAMRTHLEKKPQYTVLYDYTEDGEQLKKQLSFSWMSEEHREVLVIQSDVTQAYEKEQKQIGQLQEAVFEAEKANSAKSDFLSRISHDIRTPISIISSMTKFAIEDVDDKEKLRSDLRKIEASNTFLLSLINDVLDISKIDSGKIELHPEPYLFANYLSNIRNMFEPLCSQKNIAFSIHSVPEVGTILIDQTRLNQITLNLLSNAVKYTPEGGEVIFSAEAKKISDGKISCRICIKDNGIGMRPEFQKKMFEPFSQEYDNPEREKASTGTGLGLSIVKKIVDLMDGTIDVQSELGKGTAFTVCFLAQEAVTKDETADVPGSTENSCIETNETMSGTVLLAEDNLINTEIAKRILEGMGLSAAHAENGEEAVSMFSSSAPGAFLAILMDIQMPVLNGYEATEKIRALQREDAGSIPIIAMTADAFSAAIEHSKAIGMNDYITKPIDPNKLRQTLKKYIKPLGDSL